MGPLSRVDGGLPAAPAPPPRQAETDAQVVQLWLHGRPERTQREYRREAARFLAHVATPLPTVTLGDVQAFADTLAHLAPASQARILNTVRSLCRFALGIGYLRFNVAAPVKPPKVKDILAERILPEGEVYRLLHAAEGWDRRNSAMLLLAYGGGLRASELVGLCWRDLQGRDAGQGQATVLGKGGKTRAVLLPATVWRRVQALGPGAPDDPVFLSHVGGALSTVQAWRIVRKAARAAGIALDVSPHWLRHAHASHALDRGAPISLVQATLGHASVATTGRYLHARPSESSGKYLGLGEL